MTEDLPKDDPPILDSSTPIPYHSSPCVPVITIANYITDDYKIFASYPRFLIFRPHLRVHPSLAKEVTVVSSFPECSSFPHEFNTGNNKFLLFCFLYKIRHFIGITSSIFIVAEHDTTRHTGVMYLAALIGPLHKKNNTMQHYLQELMNTYGSECFEEYIRPSQQIDKDLEIPDHWHLRHWDFHEGFLEGLVSLNNKHLPPDIQKRMQGEIISTKALNEKVVEEQADISTAHKTNSTSRLPDLYRQFREDLSFAKTKISNPDPVVAKLDATLETLQEHLIEDTKRKVEELKRSPLVMAILRDSKKARREE